MCLLGFAGASALCGLAGNLDTLIAFRILQAIPGGVLPVITSALVMVVLVPIAGWLYDKIGPRWPPPVSPRCRRPW
jgi:MFS family permease